MKWALIPCLVLLLLPVSRAVAQNGNDPVVSRERKLTALRATEKIKVDGLLEEASWNLAPIATDFIQNEPKEGAPATFRTEVRILYDEENLYLGVVNFDDTSKLIISDLKKDYSPPDSDGFAFVLDTFHDRRNAYEFAINPAGARWDSQSTNESDRNVNWDGVWTVKTHILADRWVLEAAIPFRTLRFSNAPVQNWGINFLRRIRRLNEDSFWSPIPRIYRINRVSLAGTLEGLEGVKPGSNIRFKPYVVSSLSSTRANNLIQNHGHADAGFDFKVGLGAGTVLDGTFNTDFSQVEADEQQVNLTRFSLFFPEKRDFFLENSGIFSFGSVGELNPRAPGSSNNGRQTTGGEDFIFFFSRRIGIDDSGQEVPILGGGRLTGRAGPWSFGFLNIQTRKSGANVPTNFTVARVRRNILANSLIGAIVVNKEEPGKKRFNRGYGADWNMRLGPSLYLIGYYARTISPVKLAQHDSFRTAAAYRNRRWDFRSIYTDIGSNFNAEMGYIPRIGIKTLANYASMKFRPRSAARWLREITPTVEREHFWRRQTNQLETRYFDLRLPALMQDGGSFEVGRNTAFERLFKPFRIQSSVNIPAGDYQFNDYFASFMSSRARKASYNGRVQRGEFYSGHRTSYTVGGGLRVSYRANGTINYTRNNIQLPASRQFSTNLITARLNVSFTTAVFLNALVQYNTDARQWSSNVRFNIIHHPLSDFFLVYNERRDTITGNLLDRVIIAKVTYLFGH